MAKPHFDDCLSRQFNRLKKASVKTMTYLETHAELLSLVLPKGPLDAVISAQGDWGKASDHVEALLGSGPLGRALFTFAGLTANATSFQKAIDSMLDLVVQQSFSKEAIEHFKVEAAACTDQFKASGYLYVACIVVYVCHYGCADCTYL